MKIFSQKIVLKHLFSTFFLILFAIFCLFSILQFSLNPKAIFKLATLDSIVTEYLSNLALFFFLAIFMTMQIAFHYFTKARIIRTMTTCGVSKRKLITPFYLFGLILSAALLTHFCFAKRQISSSPKKTHAKNLFGSPPPLYVQELPHDETLVFNLHQDEPFDFFWIKHDGKIVYGNKVRKTEDQLEGLFIETYEKNASNVYELTKFEDSILLPKEFFTCQKPPKSLETASIITLIKMQRDQKTQLTSLDQKKIKSLLTFQLTQPFYLFLPITFFLIFFFNTTQAKFIPNIQFQSLLFFLLSFSWIRVSLVFDELHILSSLISLVVIPLVVLLFFSYKLYRA